MTLRLLASLAMLVAAPAAAASPKPLFEANDPIHITIRAPIKTLVQTRSSTPVAGTLITATGESLPIALSVRGITRRKSESAISRRSGSSSADRLRRPPCLPVNAG